MACDARTRRLFSVESRFRHPHPAPGRLGTGRTISWNDCGCWMVDGHVVVGPQSVCPAAVVTDRTGLTGLFDFELKWTPDTLPHCHRTRRL